MAGPDEVDVAREDLSYQDALIIAMKRERAAYELYSDMAAKVPESHLKEVLEGLALELEGVLRREHQEGLVVALVLQETV